MNFILDEHGEPQRCDDLEAWGAWFERSSRDRSRIVAADKDEGPDGGTITVSTVFLGLDHNFNEQGPPVLWESMIFGGVLDQEQRRYTSREAALAGHQELCRQVREALSK
jgi:hypothetical protein